MIISGEISEMENLFDTSIKVRFYKQICVNLFEVELRSTIPNKIKTVKQLAKHLARSDNTNSKQGEQ